VLVLTTALLLDIMAGEYPDRVHPVVWMGRFGRFWYSLSRFSTARGNILSGAGLVLTASSLFALAASSIIAFSGQLSPWLEPLMSALILKSTFSFAGLLRSGARISETLRHKDHFQARRDLTWLCSRDSSSFIETDFASGAISSLSENLSDSFIAPLFFYTLFGIPGAVVYRVVNTLDANFGYRNKEFEFFGKAPALTDDVLNFLPARMTGLLIVLFAFIRPANGVRGFRTMLSDHRKTPSPNGGWPMAATAGALGVRLSKPGCYTLFAAGSEPGRKDINRAIRLMGWTGAGAMVLFIAGGIW